MIDIIVAKFQKAKCLILKECYVMALGKYEGVFFVIPEEECNVKCRLRLKQETIREA